MVHGDYPFIMKALVRDGLPTFTDEEKALVKGSYDFIGINYYTSNYAKDIPFTPDYNYTNQAQFQHATLTSNNFNILKNHCICFSLFDFIHAISYLSILFYLAFLQLTVMECLLENQ